MPGISAPEFSKASPVYGKMRAASSILWPNINEQIFSRGFTGFPPCTTDDPNPAAGR
jgi:hypothetical protein